MIEDNLSFMVEAMAVGYFIDAEYPRQSGRYRYMPYRGPGHYQMQLELRERGSARCYYDIGTKRVSFTVIDCPAYGLLELADFETEDEVVAQR